MSEEKQISPEEAAEAHANFRCPEQGPEFIVWCMCRDDFLAGDSNGYKRAIKEVLEFIKVTQQWEPHVNIMVLNASMIEAKLKEMLK